MGVVAGVGVPVHRRHVGRGDGSHAVGPNSPIPLGHDVKGVHCAAVCNAEYHDFTGVAPADALQGDLMGGRGCVGV